MANAFPSEHGPGITGRGFFLLFLFLLATLILYPYAETTRFGYYAFRVIGSFAILMSV
jgi:small-conductance mechanosensitive channel